MEVFAIAWYREGETSINDVKYATIFAATIEEAKTKWLETEPTSKLLDALCKSLTA